MAERASGQECWKLRTSGGLFTLSKKIFIFLNILVAFQEDSCYTDIRLTIGVC